MFDNAPAPTNEPLHNVDRTLQLLGELAIPGASHIIKGDPANGLFYVAAGLLAKSFFGLPGALFVAATSFTKARTGQGIVERLVSSARQETSNDPVAASSAPDTTL